MAADGTGDEDREGARTRGSVSLLVPLLLAAGWGALFAYASVALTEDDAPLRVASLETPPQAEPAAYALPRDPLVVGTVRATMPEASTAASDAPPAAPLRPIAARSDPVRIPAPAEAPAEYVGTWGPNPAACGARGRRRGYLPATISEGQARAGRTLRRFRDERRAGPAWTMFADCSERGRRWTSQVRLVVDRDRLTWTSARGSASYVRCRRD